MTKEKSLKSSSRRAFFRKAGAGVGAAGVIAVGLSDKSARAEVKSDNDLKKSAYRETENVKRYYELARF